MRIKNNKAMFANITILIDDFNGVEHGFIKSYGFAALIEINNKKILFDTGTKIQPLLLNFKTFGVSPSSLDAVILSHNHYDHTDGLPGILKENKNIAVYVHRDWDAQESCKGITVPKKNQVILEKGREISEISLGLFLTNSLWSSDYGGIHEQALFIKTNESYILLCGYCHPRLSAILKERTNLGIQLDTPLHIIGGMHGFKFSNEEAKQLNPMLKSVILCHCTMNAAIFKKQFGDKCFVGIVGKKYKFS